MSIAGNFGGCKHADDGISETARETGITRDGLCKKSSRQVNTSFDTVLKASKALGIRFQRVDAYLTTTGAL